MNIPIWALTKSFGLKATYSDSISMAKKHKKQHFAKSSNIISFLSARIGEYRITRLE